MQVNELVTLPPLTKLGDKLVARYRHAEHGNVELLIYRKVDHAVIPKYQRYAWTLNNGTYGSNLDASQAEVKKLLKGIQQHATTSDFHVHTCISKGQTLTNNHFVRDNEQ